MIAEYLRAPDTFQAVIVWWPRSPSFSTFVHQLIHPSTCSSSHSYKLFIYLFIHSLLFFLYLFIHSLAHQFTCSFILRILLIYLFTCSLFALSLTLPLHFSNPHLLISSLIHTLAYLYITPSIPFSTYPSHTYLSLHPSITPSIHPFIQTPSIYPSIHNSSQPAIRLPTSILSGLMLILKIKK